MTVKIQKPDCTYYQKYARFDWQPAILWILEVVTFIDNAFPYPPCFCMATQL